MVQTSKISTAVLSHYKRIVWMTQWEQVKMSFHSCPFLEEEMGTAVRKCKRRNRQRIKACTFR